MGAPGKPKQHVCWWDPTARIFRIFCRGKWHEIDDIRRFLVQYASSFRRTFGQRGFEREYEEAEERDRHDLLDRVSAVMGDAVHPARDTWRDVVLKLCDEVERLRGGGG